MEFYRQKTVLHDTRRNSQFLINTMMQSTEAVARSCSVKQVFLNISKNLQESHLC